MICCWPNSSNKVCTDIALCTGAQSCWKRKGFYSSQFPQRWKHSIVQNIWACWSIKKNNSLEITGLAQLHPIIPPLHQIYIWHSAVRQVMIFWHTPNPDSPIRLPIRETWFSQNRFPLLQGSVACAVLFHHSIQCLSLYLVMWGLHAAAQP